MQGFQTCTITITDQADIESGSLSSCPDGASRFISVRNATNILNFTSLIQVDNIDVTHSPRLEILDFPQLKSLIRLNVNGATSLSSISMRQLLSLPSRIYTNGDYTLPASGYNQPATSVINITGCPSLGEIDLQAATGLHMLGLRDVPPWSNPNITSVVMLETNSCMRLSSLGSVRNLHLIGKNIQNCFLFPSLASVFNFTLTNIGPSEITWGQAALTITDTLALESSVVEPSAYDLTLKLSPIASVGSNAFVTSNENAHIELGNLASVKGNLSIHNNRNCTFDFDHLTEVGNLLLVDNQDTPLPSFSSLARVNTIHLRGHIDKANIFPALTSVSDTVTIEAWNDDFDCAKLVSQHLEGTIPNLVCNGTNNGTKTSNGGPASWPLLPPPADSLSEGAKAGIGVGGIAGVLGAVIAIIWLVLRFKIQLKELSQKDLALRPVEGGDTASLRGPESRGLIRERPDDPIHEIQGRVQAHLADGRMVALDDSGEEIHELPSAVAAAELPSTPAFQTRDQIK